MCQHLFEVFWQVTRNINYELYLNLKVQTTFLSEHIPLVNLLMMAVEDVVQQINPKYFTEVWVEIW